MTKTVEFFFDVGSPTSYLAWTQLPRLCAEAGASLACRPMLLGGVFQATGNASPAAVPAKGRYMKVDMARFVARYGVAFNGNPFFPINTLALMRAVTGVQLDEPARFDAFLDAVFRAIWVDALDLNQPSIAQQAIVDAGFDASTVFERANQPAAKTRLRETTDEALARGVFGAPTMFVGSEMFFGQDRLDFVREALG